MQRGDVVVAAVGGDYGKPRPAVVVQTAALLASHASVVICQMTSVIVDPSPFRINLEPAPGNGLRRRCQVMIDKPVTIRRTKIGSVVGRLTAQEMDRVNHALTFVLGVAD